MFPPPASRILRTGSVELAQLPHDRAAVLARGDEEHLVVGFDHGVALGDDPDPVAEDRRDPRDSMVGMRMASSRRA